MTDPTPLDRDELLAAYLDAEATPAERARVEADPELMERAMILREVADMVAEPVLSPSPEVKRNHIATALAASPTAANVTALATRRKRLDMTKLAAVAAVVIAVLAVPIVLLSGGDDDDSAATATGDAATASQQPPIETAAGDDGADDDGSGAVAEELLADRASDDEDSAEGDSAGAEMALEEPEQESAAEPEPAGDGAAEASDDGGDAPAADVSVPFARLIGPVDDIEALAAEVLRDADTDAGDDDSATEGLFIEDLPCVLDWLDSGGVGDAILVEAGIATLPAGDRSWALVEDGDGARFVVFDGACAIEAEYRPG